MNRLISWLLDTSLYTAACALSLCMATEKALLGHFPPLFSPLHAIIMGSTLVEYNVHRLVNRKTDTRPADRWCVALVITGALMCLTAAPFTSLRFMLWLCVLGLLSFGYSIPFLPFPGKRRLKDFGIIKILILTMVWVIATLVLPLVYWDGPLDIFLPRMGLRFLFIFALCIAFDIRDVQQDTSRNVRTVPGLLGIKASYRLIDFVLVIFVLGGCYESYKTGQVSYVLVTSITAVAARAAIWYARHHRSSFAYIGLIDGVMLLNGLLLLFLL